MLALEGNVIKYTYNLSFIINLGKGSASQVIDIIIQDKYNIEIKREVIAIGHFYYIKLF